MRAGTRCNRAAPRTEAAITTTRAAAKFRMNNSLMTKALFRARLRAGSTSGRVQGSAWLAYLAGGGVAPNCEQHLKGRLFILISPNPSTDTALSDKALAVFAFALYHQLESGEPVSRVVLSDGAGRQADGDAVDQLQRAGLATVDGNWIAFTEAGLGRIAALADAARSSAGAS